jgi:hypothetical protein
MKFILLGLITVLFGSCATVGGVYYSASSLAKEPPRFAKGFDMRKAGDRYVIEYAYGFSKEDAAQLPRPTWGYERKFASLDRKHLERLCSGDSMPLLRKQDLILESMLSKSFDSGASISFPSVGCRESPLFEIADQPSFRTTAKVGVITASLAVDAGLVYLFPIAYPVFAVCSGAMVAAFIQSSMH